MHILRLWIALLLPSCCYSFYAVEDLSLEEKVGQLLMCHFHGSVSNDAAKMLIQELHVGGIIYYTWANELSSPQQVFELSRQLQELSSDKPPLLIAADQEGGIVAPLTEGFTVFPGNRALGSIQDEDLAQAAAYAIGEELHGVGVNMNLAPVVDINTNPYNPVIGIRSFGDTAEMVLSLGRPTLQGYHDAHILTSLKHFPGHGDTYVDSHEALPILNKNLEELRQCEWIPFKALAQETDTIMTAHVMIPSLDPKYCATLSTTILDLLRTELQFEGVIISDSLKMKALFYQYNSLEELALQAFLAGCDILLIGGRRLNGSFQESTSHLANIRKVHAYLVQAVKEGKISEARLNASVQRILTLKAKNTLLSPEVLPLESIRSDKHQLLSQHIASAALNILKEPSISCLENSRVALFAPTSVAKTLSSYQRVPSTVHPLFFNTSYLSQEKMQAAMQLARESDYSIFFSDNAWKSQGQSALIEALLQHKKPLILVVTRDPIDASLFSHAEGVIITYSPTPPSIEAVLDYLFFPHM